MTLLNDFFPSDSHLFLSTWLLSQAAALIASAIPESQINTASIKQILIESAGKIDSIYNIYEQGNGKLDLQDAFRIATEYKPKVSAVPSKVDLTDCPYMWPYCKQPLFWSGSPTIFNVTILNAVAVTSWFAGPPVWIPKSGGEYLNVTFSFPSSIWPYSGWLALHISVQPEASKVSSTAEGIARVRIRQPGSSELSEIDIPITAAIVPTPSRTKRILWDQFHSIRYPGGYVPKDALWIKSDRPFDWHADHLFTNFDDLFNSVRGAGFYLDILGVPLSCVDLSLYGTVLIVDPEEEFYEDEIAHVQDAVTSSGVSVIVVSDWYNLDLIRSLRFFDDNSRQWWLPMTGGSNVPALNDLLAPFGIQLGSRVFSGDFFAGDRQGFFASGTSIVEFPERGILYSAPLEQESPGATLEDVEKRPNILGLLQLNPHSENETAGRIAVFGDSSCLDSSSRMESKNCLWLLHDLLKWSSQAIVPNWIKDTSPLTDAFLSETDAPPLRLQGSQLFRYSTVLSRPLECPGQKTSSGVLTPSKPQRKKITESSSSGFFKEDVLTRAHHRRTPDASSTTGRHRYIMIGIVLVTAFVAFISKLRRSRVAP